MTALAGLAIVVVGAGASTRMGFDKLWAEIQGRPMIAYALETALLARPGELIAVVARERVESVRQRLGVELHGVAVKVVEGGARRRDSVEAGVRACTAPWVAIHDAARAFTPMAVYERTFAAARATGAAVPVLPIADTVKRVSGDLVLETLPRAELRAVQTPQVFRRDLLEQALASTPDDVTDEASLFERLGIPVAICAGDAESFKITRPFDMVLAACLLNQPSDRRGSRPGSPPAPGWASHATGEKTFPRP